MINFVEKPHYDLYDLKKLIALLRSESGCPWDRVQTHDSIRRNFLEEVYEAIEAIDNNDPLHLKEELGDVLLQIAFHSQIEEECGNFDLDAVADAVCKKLIFRHPHVFASLNISSTDEVLTNWEQLKDKEKGHSSTSSAMNSVSKALPALWRAEKIQHKAANFLPNNFNSLPDASIKLSDTFSMLNEIMSNNGDLAAALGDLLFSVVNFARLAHIDPEFALSRATDRFIALFSSSHIEHTSL